MEFSIPKKMLMGVSTASMQIEGGQLDTNWNDADMVLFLYRDEYYKEPKDGKSVAEVIVAKNRHGSVGKVEMGWIGEYTKFSDLAEEPGGEPPRA